MSGWQGYHVGQGPLYLALVLTCCLPVGLVCARTFVGRRPRSLSERSFAIAYDVLLKRSAQMPPSPLALPPDTAWLSP